MNEEKKNGELVPIERTLPQRIADAKGQVEAINELRLVSLKLLKPKSLTNQGGNPYIRSNAAGLIGGRFGVSVYNMVWQPVEERKHNDGNPDEIIYTVDGLCEFDGNTFPVTGVSTTRDNFFGKKTVDGQKVFKQYHEIDFASLKLKAVTRLRGNAARAALDLNSLDWPEVTAATGIKKEDVAGVEYGGGSGKKQDLSDAGKSALKEIKELLNYCFLGVAADAKAWLFKETTFDIIEKDDSGNVVKDDQGKPVKRTVNGKQDPNKLTEKQIPHILTKLKKLKQRMVDAETNPPEAKS
jgi:hypothetical protein